MTLVTSNIESITIIPTSTNTNPTYLSLSNSGSSSYMTFTVTSNPGTNFDCSLYAYSSSADASNVPSYTGMIGEWVNLISVKNGVGSITLNPSSINNNTQYWIAYYKTDIGSVLKSNILTVVG